MRWLTAVACLVLSACAHEPLDLPNGSEPLPDVTASGQPSAPTFEALAARGYTSVIDLRRPSENRGFDEAAAVEATGMSYVNLPIGRDGITWENASVLDKALAEKTGPVLVHCGSSNRVGALIALRAKLAGASDEEALALGREAGLTSLEPVVVDRLKEGPPR